MNQFYCFSHRSVVHKVRRYPATTFQVGIIKTNLNIGVLTDYTIVMDR